MSDTDANAAAAAEARELRRVRNLLKQMGEIAEHASLTGALDGGAADLAERYNLIVRHLEEKGTVSGPFFPPLPADADIDRVGVACKLLAGYLEEEEEEATAEAGRGSGKIHGDIIIGNLSGVGGPEVEQLRDLGKLIRESLPEFLRAREGAAPPPPPPPPPAPPIPFPAADLDTAPTTEQRRP